MSNLVATLVILLIIDSLWMIIAAARQNWVGLVIGGLLAGLLDFLIIHYGGGGA